MADQLTKLTKEEIYEKYFRLHNEKYDLKEVIKELKKKYEQTKEGLEKLEKKLNSSRFYWAYKFFKKFKKSSPKHEKLYDKDVKPKYSKISNNELMLDDENSEPKEKLRKSEEGFTTLGIENEKLTNQIGEYSKIQNNELMLHNENSELKEKLKESKKKLANQIDEYSKIQN